MLQDAPTPLASVAKAFPVNAAGGEREQGAQLPGGPLLSSVGSLLENDVRGLDVQHGRGSRQKADHKQGLVQATEPKTD